MDLLTGYPRGGGICGQFIRNRASPATGLREVGSALRMARPFRYTASVRGGLCRRTGAPEDLWFGLCGRVLSREEADGADIDSTAEQQGRSRVRHEGIRMLELCSHTERRPAQGYGPGDTIWWLAACVRRARQTLPPAPSRKPRSGYPGSLTEIAFPKELLRGRPGSRPGWCEWEARDFIASRKRIGRYPGPRSASPVTAGILQ